MKKPHIPVLLVATCIFSAFLGGLFVGQNLNRTPVQISALPEQVQQTQPAEQTLPAATEAQILNINTATVEQLDTLPGIGPVLAQRIVDYRTACGPYQDVGELTNVEGIGLKKLEAIWDLITIGE